MKTFAVLLAAAIVVAPCAFAQTAAAPPRLELYPNFQTMSVYLHLPADAPRDLPTVMEYRREGEASWRRGHDLTRIADHLLTGSIFWLEPDTAYEVRVTFPDAAAAPVAQTLKTRRDVWPTGSGRTIHVAPGGAGDGAAAAPLGSVQQAVDLARPGDTVLLAPGVYRESVVVRNSGTPEAYILIRGEPGATLDGSDAGFLDRSAPSRWRSLPGDREASPYDFVADCDWKVNTVHVDDEKLYGYSTLDDMRLCRSGPPGGWYQDLDAGKLYIHRTAAYVSPSATRTAVSRLDYGLVLDGCRHVVVHGLNVRFFGRVGIEIRGSGNVVEHCLVAHQDVGINLYGKDFHDNTIQDCHVYQTGVYRWPWHMTKGTRYEVDSIGCRGGRGNVVRRNVVHGSFDGIGLSVWEALHEPGWMQDTDVNDNYIYDCGDDGAEPEGTCTNLRFFNNRVRGCLMNMSIAPVTVGPAWFINETYWDFLLGCLKIKVRTSGVVYLYNCTFHANGWRQSIWDYGGQWHNLHFRNCIFSANDYVFRDSGPSKEGTVTFDYNNLYTTRDDRFVVWEGRAYSNIAEFQRSGYEENGISADPMFVESAAGDFHLLPESPCIDAGVHIPGINDDFSGAAPDIGSHERRPVEQAP